jgi:hypothetical protein
MQYFFTDRYTGVDKDKLQKKVGDKRVIFMNQIHSSSVQIVDNSSPSVIKECDAIITQEKGLALCVVVADCNPILFYDKTKQVVAAAHAGRVGSYGAIATKTLQLMQQSFTCKPIDIEVFIGPSIRKCCYEVGVEVTRGFEKFTCKKEGKIFLDLLSLNLEQLTQGGILRNNIKVHPSCTCCDANYFSYRREATKQRFCGVIGL